MPKQSPLRQGWGENCLAAAAGKRHFPIVEQLPILGAHKSRFIHAI